MSNASDFGRVRSRVLGVERPQISGTVRFYSGGAVFSTQKVGGLSLTGSEKTQDATHPDFILFSRYPKEFNKLAQSALFGWLTESGGNFKSTKVLYGAESGKEVSISTGGPNRTTYDGWVLPVNPSAIVQVAPPPDTDSYLMDLGAKQILYNLPNRPLVGISQTLAELRREGLPRTRALATFRSWSPRKGGQDYLTWQFGFRPVIQDIYALARSIDTADKQWRTYVNGANKLQRRHYEFPVEQSTTTTQVVTGGSVYPGLPTNICTGQSTPLYCTRTVRTVRRFSAAYAYALPHGTESTIKAVRKAIQYQQQYGLRIDPALLWELAPWSWLIDWVLPLGKFLESAQSLLLGNTALPWAFISTHSRVTDVYERPGARLYDGSSVGPLTVVTDYKRRLKANPFGFGINWLDLSPKQLSILAAIGITR